MMFNNKMYEKFYPLTTEEDKESFINSNYQEILKIVGNIGYSANAELSALEYDYASKMKPTVSFWGTPKYKNIVHNEKVTDEMLRDKTMDFISKEISDLESVKYSLVNGEIEKISIEELNHILQLANAMKHKEVCTIILGVGVFLIFTWWLLVR